MPTWSELLFPDMRRRVERELAEAQRGLLDAHSAREYATAMVEYQTQRVDRLKHMRELLNEEPLP